jgi:hypothetical protein
VYTFEHEMAKIMRKLSQPGKNLFHLHLHLADFPDTRDFPSIPGEETHDILYPFLMDKFVLHMHMRFYRYNNFGHSARFRRNMLVAFHTDCFIKPDQDLLRGCMDTLFGVLSNISKIVCCANKRVPPPQTGPPPVLVDYHGVPHISHDTRQVAFGNELVVAHQEMGETSPVSPFESQKGSHTRSWEDTVPDVFGPGTQQPKGSKRRKTRFQIETSAESARKRVAKSIRAHKVFDRQTLEDKWIGKYDGPGKKGRYKTLVADYDEVDATQRALVRRQFRFFLPGGKRTYEKFEPHLVLEYLPDMAADIYKYWYNHAHISESQYLDFLAETGSSP